MSYSAKQVSDKSSSLASLDALTSLSSAPVSLARVHRNAHLTLDTTRQDVHTFINSELKRPKADEKRLLALVRSLQDLSGIEILEPETANRVLDDFVGDSRIDQSDANGLSKVCRRLFIFKRMLEAVRARLNTVLHHSLYKYCLSFIEEAEQQQELEPVVKYEQMIRATKDEIEQRRKAMKELEESGNFKELEVSEYIKRHNEVNQLMENWCEQVIKITKLAEDWIIYDHNYPKKLQERITQLAKMRMNSREQLQQLETRSLWDHNRVLKAEFAKSKAERYLKEIKSEWSSYTARERNIEQTRMRLQDLLHEIIATRDRHLVRLSEPNVTESVRKFHLSAVQDCESRRLQLEKRLATVSTQVAELQREQERCSTNSKAGRQLLQERERTLQQLLDELSHVKLVEKTLQTELDGAANEVKTLQKIREIKLHSDTVRKIHSFGYQPGQYQEVRDGVDDIFKDLSTIIGGKWRQVYLKLPFQPSRDYPTRVRDLEMIDISHRRLDVTLDVLAYKSLQKWRRISWHNATVDTLFNTLRMMRLIGVQTSR